MRVAQLGTGRIGAMHAETLAGLLEPDKANMTPTQLLEHRGGGAELAEIEHELEKPIPAA